MARIAKTVNQGDCAMLDRTSYLGTSLIQSDKINVTARLIELILKMPEADQRNLLKKLETKHTGNAWKYPVDQRKYPRKTTFIAVDFSTHDVRFTDFIQNISNGGVFIQTGASFYRGQQISMTFSLPKFGDGITIKGEVVRFDAQGIGVKFTNGKAKKLNLIE